MALWAAGIVASIASGMHLHGFSGTVLAPINLEFFFGIIAARMLLAGRVPPAWMAVTAGVLCVLVWTALGASRNQSYLVGLAIAAVIPTVCRAEIAGKLTIPGTLVFLGTASYAIYLTHNPALSIINRIAAGLGVSGWLFGLLVSATVATSIGVLYYVAFEWPAMRLAKGKSLHVSDLGILDRARRGP
jgi:peptidoglycan/LPS O-acetylase OafA/YrhL